MAGGAGMKIEEAEQEELCEKCEKLVATFECDKCKSIVCEKCYYPVSDGDACSTCVEGE